MREWGRGGGATPNLNVIGEHNEFGVGRDGMGIDLFQYRVLPIQCDMSHKKNEQASPT